MYGHEYSPTTISNIAKAVEDQVKEFHNRKVAKRYAVIYCDATYLNLRRDSVAKEAVHVLLGITPDGYSEYNRKGSQRIHKGFKDCSGEIEQLFAEKYPSKSAVAKAAS